MNPLEKEFSLIDTCSCDNLLFKLKVATVRSSLTDDGLDHRVEHDPRILTKG